MPPKTPKNKAEMDEKSDSKSVTPASGGDSRCGACSKPVTDRDNGVACEICDTWYHSRCQGISDAMYKTMKQYPELHWFCKNCRHGAERIMAALSLVQTKMVMMENEAAQHRNELKTEIGQLSSVLNEIKGDITTIGNRMDQCELRTEQGRRELQGTVNDTLRDIQSELITKEVPKWSEVVTREMEVKLTAVSDNMASVQSALQQQTKSMLDDKCEQEEINKRKCNLIIHGLSEPREDNAEKAKMDDNDQVAEILHEMNCDEVSVDSVTRLGRKASDPEVKPRPILLTIASEKQKDKILRMTKNLKQRNSTGPDKIFMHQDYTPRQRERRRMLVKEMKQRQADGETDLILINFKIVKRREDRC